MFATELKRRLNGQTSSIFAYSLVNEGYFMDTALPFSSTSINVTTADGITYSMSDASSRQQCADANVVNWVNLISKSIKSVDPDAMVTAGMFTFQAVAKAGPNGILPQGSDPRHPFRPLILTIYSNLDYVDVHIYPLGDINTQWSFTADLASSEWPLKFNRMPVLMAEFGAFKYFFNLDQAVSEMVELQRLSCPQNFSGWSLWTFDTWEQSGFLWDGVDGNNAISNALSPVQRSDPCK